VNSVRSRPHVVDQQERLCRQGVGQQLRSPLACPQAGEAGHAGRPERRGALVDHGADLAQQPGDRVWLVPATGGADVREVGEVEQAAAAEVDRVDLHLVWAPVAGEGVHERAQEGGLARARGADQGHVPAGTVQLQRQRTLPLPVWLIQQPDHRVQAAGR